MLVGQTNLHLSEDVGTKPSPVRDDRTPQERRFWSRVNWNGPVNPRRPELGPCWLWTGSRYSDATGLTYGQTTYNGKRMGAHRASFLMHGGVVPDGHDVMHRCDVKACVRPDHLSAGTRTENLLDGFASPANQGACAGENNGRARLTWDDVHAIRNAPRRYGSIPVLAAQYGVTTGQINQIRSGKKWPESKCPLHSVAVAA